MILGFFLAKAQRYYHEFLIEFECL